MNIKYIYLITFIIYYLIATFIFCNLLFNSNLNVTLVNTKTKEEKNPSSIFLILYCLFWIISIPLSKFGGEEEQ